MVENTLNNQLLLIQIVMILFKKSLRIPKVVIRSRLNRRRRDNEIAKIKRTKQKPNNGRQNTRYKTGY